MKYCDKCEVNVISKEEKCPLCQNPLTKGKDQEVFPYVPSIYKKYSFFFKMLIFISLIISSICILINILIPTEVFWSVFVLAGFACLILILRISINKKHDIPSTTLTQIVILSILSLLWDYFTGWRGWSITYVIPIVCVIGSINMAIIVKVMKLYIKDYFFYFLLTIMLGLVPAIFWFTGIVQTVYPSIICVFVNFLALITMLVFAGNLVVEELKRRLHF